MLNQIEGLGHPLIKLLQSVMAGAAHTRLREDLHPGQRARPKAP